MSHDIIIQTRDLRYSWKVIYQDNTFLAQNIGKEDEHHAGHIDFDRVAYFILEDKEGKPQFGVNLNQRVFMAKLDNFPANIPEGEWELVFFRRTPVGGESVIKNGSIVEVRSVQQDEPVYYMGMRTKCGHCKDGRKQQVMMFVNPDDSFGFERDGA